MVNKSYNNKTGHKICKKSDDERYNFRVHFLFYSGNTYTDLFCASQFFKAFMISSGR